jgi:hypothetical protein
MLRTTISSKRPRDCRSAVRAHARTGLLFLALCEASRSSLVAFVSGLIRRLAEGRRCQVVTGHPFQPRRIVWAPWQAMEPIGNDADLLARTPARPISSRAPKAGGIRRASFGSATNRWSPAVAGCTAGNGLVVSAYRCVDVADRNRKNVPRPTSPLRPVVTRRAVLQRTSAGELPGFENSLLFLIIS